VAPAVKQKHYFRLAYGVLALAFWLSVAGFTYLMTRPDHASSQAWSEWRPTNDDLSGAREIAQRVARQYRNDSGAQLVAIQEHPPEVQGLRLEAIGVRRPHRNGQIDPYIALYGGRRTLIYAFCGLGSNCSLVDTASQELDNFLRREALEVSLYSFKYLAGVEQVISLLPPTTDATGGQSSAVFLARTSCRPSSVAPCVTFCTPRRRRRRRSRRARRTSSTPSRCRRRTPRRSSRCRTGT
jgi:hypothetical protein